jgi:outer membrane protein assembly factor BamB
MKKILACVVFFGVTSRLFAQNITDEFPLKWKVNIGQTTYRNNIILHNNLIITGSNGVQLSSPVADEKDGVYLINARSGKVEHKIRPMNQGDGDVNGVAVNGNKLFFGDDNAFFYCYELSGKKIWEYQITRPQSGNEPTLRGNIESCPVLAKLNDDNELDVAFTVRGLGVIALNGKTGEELWRQELTDAEGAYMSSPAIWDVNKDGTEDILAGGWGYGGYGNNSFFNALNGKTGEILWRYTLNTGVKASPVIVKKGENVQIIATQTYSNIYFLSTEGVLTQYISLNEKDGGISGLYSSPILSPNGTLAIGSAWWDETDGIWLANVKPENFSYDSENQLGFKEDARKFTQTNRVSASAVVADVIGNGKFQILIPTEKGELLIFEENEMLIRRFTLPAGVEATPLVKDIDSDGFLEILIATKDGFLNCYKTKSKGKVAVSQFRMDNRNSGVIEIK